ncbi:MAG: phytanoyl-CoA dioxygenase family protein [Planctomycetaceae bacterium]
MWRKRPSRVSRFSWHQDSGGISRFPHRPYVTVWAAVDDMTIENGTAYVLPIRRSGIRTLVEHVRDPETGDKTGYFGKEPRDSGDCAGQESGRVQFVNISRQWSQRPTKCGEPT